MKLRFAFGRNIKNALTTKMFNRILFAGDEIKNLPKSSLAAKRRKWEKFIYHEKKYNHNKQ